MNAEIALQAFLGHVKSDRRERLLMRLPSKMRSRLEGLPHYRAFPSDEDPLESVHWSWFLPTIKSHTEEEQGWFLSMLPAKTAERLKSELSWEGTQSTLTEIGKTFLYQYLFRSLEDGYAPLTWLPPSRLLPLTTLTKRQLESLIDSLALPDLAFSLRQIVETKILKRIYSLVSEETGKLLRRLAATTEQSLFPRIEFDSWNGGETEFHALLHRRGLLHLAAALSSEAPALLWHVAHRLDIGRGNLLCKLAEETPRTLSEPAGKQVEELLAKRK